MKVSIGYNVIDGPWGGGNQFVSSLINALKSKGHKVVHDLKDRDIDVILIVDPRSRNPDVSFSTGSILRYLIFKNFKSIVVHRINECDERKNTKTMNFKLRVANYCADQTIIVGEWMKKLNIFFTEKNKNILTIRNGSNNKIFNSIGYKKWNYKSKFKLVTHHWSGNWMKGFDIYKKIDFMLEKKQYKDIFEFTYIGNLPKNFTFKNSRHVKPLYGKKLADELKKHHGYITASINEPGGNHQNEAALCGLPLLYRDSGCLPEYCDGYGIKFNEKNFEKKIIQFKNHYNSLTKKMKKYPFTDIETNKLYIDLFLDLISKKDNVVKNRKLFSSPFMFLINHCI